MIGPTSRPKGLTLLIRRRIRLPSRDLLCLTDNVAFRTGVSAAPLKGGEKPPTRAAPREQKRCDDTDQAEQRHCQHEDQAL